MFVCDCMLGSVVRMLWRLNLESDLMRFYVDGRMNFVTDRYCFSSLGFTSFVFINTPQHPFMEQGTLRSFGVQSPHCTLHLIKGNHLRHSFCANRTGLVSVYRMSLSNTCLLQCRMMLGYKTLLHQASTEITNCLYLRY